MWTVLRPVIALYKAVTGWSKKARAEKAAALGRPSTAYSPAEKLDRQTLIHLGAASSNAPAWRKLPDILLQRLVQTEFFNKPHVRDWLSTAETQRLVLQLAHARIAGAPEAPAGRNSLIASYMAASGEHAYFADAFIDQMINVFVAGIVGGAQDPALAAQLQISVRFLQQRLEAVVAQFASPVLPEVGWSLDVAYQTNVQWLQAAFASRSKAKVRLGQPLTPADTALPFRAVQRAGLLQTLEVLLEQVPAGGVLAITGGEGHGKSWLTGQAWLARTHKPLTLFLSADDIEHSLTDPMAFLASQLSTQTDRRGSAPHQAAWLTQLTEWRTQRQGPPHGMLVILDGLNQRRTTEWARIVDRLGEALEPIGGKLVVTARKHYFEDAIKPRLAIAWRELIVPEWTPAERDVLLSASGLQGNQLHSQVATVLCNPRLLGIALTLLDSAQLRAAEELSVPLLLFEHLRASQRDTYRLSADHFAQQLQSHADEVVRRLCAQQQDDLRVFRGELDAVVEGRFFVPLADDRTRYTVREEGLDLALGLALLDELRKAQRNGRDLSERLAVLTEPIVALDRTAEALLAALTVACVSDEIADDIGAAVLMEFVSLQNPPDDAPGAMVALARYRPHVFLIAVHRLALQGGRAFNSDWLVLALEQAKTTDHVWNKIAAAIESWLAHTTLDIEERAAPFGSIHEEAEARREELQAELDARVARLSLQEQNIFNTLERTTARDVSSLWKVALQLLAGMPLARFAPAFVHWSFAKSLSGSIYAPYTEFRHLIRYNAVDWAPTRLALLEAMQPLDAGSVSPVGQWARVTLLAATGHPDDARQAHALSAALRAGEPAPMRWRLLEDYCRTDPCDPTKPAPDNVGRTANTYAAFNVAELAMHMGMAMPDRFFDDARPAVARYYPDIAIERHRAWVSDVLRRRGLPLRQGIVRLLDHAALVTLDLARRIVERSYGPHAEDDVLGSLGNEATTWSQFQLEIAFPALDAQTQLDALLQARVGDQLALNLIRLIKPLDDSAFERALVRALATRDCETQYIVLLFSPFVGQALSPAVRDLVPVLLCSESTLVRAHVLRMLVDAGDVAALHKFVVSGWNPAAVPKDARREKWFGSAALLEVALRGILPWQDVVDYLDLQHLVRLAARLGGAAASHVASVIDVLITRVLKLPIDAGMLEIELSQSPCADPQPQYFRLNEREIPQPNHQAGLQSLLEHDEAFDERQRNLRAAFDSLLATLESRQADQLLDQFATEDFSVIAAANPALVEHWCAVLLEQPDGTHLSAVHNIGVLVARAIAQRDSALAVRLFEKLQTAQPLVRVVAGHACIDLFTMTLWSMPAHEALDSWRMQRLDRAINNDELATEVWAALGHNQDALLQQYITQRLASDWPVAQARAILVAGLMRPNHYSDEVLDRFAHIPGLLGETQQVARDAYDHHAWARHWYDLMQSASCPEQFWRAAVLFLVVVDERLEMLPQPGSAATVAFQLYWPSVERQLRNRFDKLRKKRKARLLADEAPWEPFLKERKFSEGLSYIGT